VVCYLEQLGTQQPVEVTTILLSARPSGLKTLDLRLVMLYSFEFVYVTIIPLQNDSWNI